LMFMPRPPLQAPVCTPPQPRIPCLTFFSRSPTPPTELYTLSLHDALPIYLDFSITCKGKKRSSICPFYSAYGHFSDSRRTAPANQSWGSFVSLCPYGDTCCLPR